MTTDNFTIHIDGKEYECVHGTRVRIGLSWAVRRKDSVIALALVMDERSKPWLGGGVDPANGVCDDAFARKAAEAIAKHLGVKCRSGYSP